MQALRVLVVRPFESGERDVVVALWRACGLTRPWNDPHRDIDRKLAQQPELFLVAEDDGALVGTAMAGYDGHRGWVHYVAVQPGRWGDGIGRALMGEAERRLVELGCPKVEVMVRIGNEQVLSFYERIGYGAQAAVVLGKRLIADD